MPSIDYAKTTTCRCDELKPGDQVVRIGEALYPDGRLITAAPLPLGSRYTRDADRPEVHLQFLGSHLTVPCDRLAWVAG